MAKFLDADEFSVDDIFKAKYIIPVYQRPYKWENKQVKQLLIDIDAAFENSKKGNNGLDDYLFAGTMFIKETERFSIDLHEYRVVDGQQRITTLTLILMAILNYLYSIDSDDDSVTEIRNYIWKKSDRKIDKNKRVLTLGNIDKPILEELMDELFNKHDITKYSESKLGNTSNAIEVNLLNNYIYIANYLKKYEICGAIYNYYDFLKEHVKFIGIRINTNMVKLFSIFESINSKGKPLEDIDLIKSYIFQNLSEDDYDEYLKKWGELIEKTNDNINDYFTLFIRAHISYYRFSIKLDNFKTLANGTLQRYYKNQDIPSMLKCFINDMLNQVKYYRQLTDINELEVKAQMPVQTIAILRMKNLARYNNMDPLVFKLLEMKGKGLDEKYLDSLIDYAFRFLLTFQTISARESKHSISAFSDVQNIIYRNAGYYEDEFVFDDNIEKQIINIFNKRIMDNAINNNSLVSSIKNTMTYNKNRNVVKVLLTFLWETDSNNTNYSMINDILKLNDDIQVDHLLPQQPKWDSGFGYYADGDVIVLKQDQDFIEDKSITKVPIRDFLDSYLHKLGNLRLEWANENARKSNHLIKLEEFDHPINKYKETQKRGDELIDQVIESNWLLSTDNIDYVPEIINAKRVQVVDSNNYDQFNSKGYHPISFTICGKDVFVEKRNYAGLIEDCVSEITSMETDKMLKLAINGFYPTDSNSPYITNDKESLRDPVVIREGIYAEKNIASSYALFMLYKLMEELGLNESDLTIQCEEN